jgi:hypothetical protein
MRILTPLPSTLFGCNKHLFANPHEQAGTNVALTYYIRDEDPDTTPKYSFWLQQKVYKALQRTIKAGFPSSNRIFEDID